MHGAEYFIVLYDLVTKTKVTLADTTNAAKAYELAHEFDAATRFGRDDDESGKWPNACLVGIEDSAGKSKWRECCEARCPSAGLFVSEVG